MCSSDLLQALNDSLETRILESTAALRSSEARLKEAQALGGIGHWELDLTSGTMHWSEEICRLAGFDPSSVTPSYELFLDKVHPEDRAQIVAANQRLLELREPLELNYRLLLKDGEVRHVQARLVTQVDQEGQPIRVIGTSQDVSRLVASQRQLRESEQSFRSLFELSPLGIALIDQEGRCLRSNQAFRRLIEGETNHGAPIELSAEATILLERIRRSTLESEDLSPTSDHLLPRLDGSLVPVRVRAQRLTTTEANHAHPPVWLMLEDRTGQLAREQELRQAANVFRYAQEGIMITKLDSTIIDVNEAFCQITGYERQDVLGATPNLLKSGVHDGAFYSEMWRQLETAGAWSGEVTNRAKDGSHREMLETISAVKGDDGQVSHYVALLTDIRQIKDQQRQLEQLALYDTLTGLPNRILLARELQQAMHRSQNGEHTIAVCYLDLDGFKEINDNLGHAAGDHLLKVLAARMGAVLRPGDLLARLGGDEFVLILRESPGETFEQTTAVLELILETLMQQVHWNGEAMQVTASIGVSRYPHDLRDQGPDQLLRHADNAMYNAKRLGKNRYAFASA